MKEKLLEQLSRMQTIACSSKWSRLLFNPYRYLSAVLFHRLIYPRTKKEARREATLFFGKKMLVALPASMDIYLTGGKSHDSEIRLARFMILQLAAGDHFLDIGAHYGYFSLLAAELVGRNGRVQSYEPSSATYEILSINTDSRPEIAAFHKAVSDTGEPVTFFEFSNLYSEYNSIDVAQFSDEEWFRRHQPRKTTVETTTIDNMVQDASFRPSFIKVDVEGAELKVLRGGLAYLQAQSPVLVMEYLEPRRGNEAHRQALALLVQLGYVPCVIDAAGGTTPVQDVEAYLQRQGLESDNIVFRKNG